MTTEIEWRREWSPDLVAQPWRPVSLEGADKTFLVKALIREESYEFLVSDTLDLWYEHLDRDGVKNRTKRLNPSIEAPISKILDHLRESLESDRNKQSTLSVTFKNSADADEQKAQITLSNRLASLPFVWKFSAYPADSEMVSNHLTVPLLAMVGELSRRQHELYRLLKNKDKEIEDLKSQGIKVSRKHLETPAFDEIVFKHNMTTSKGFGDQVAGECTKAFDSEGQDLYRDIMTKYAYINRPERTGEEVGATFSGDGEPSNNSSAPSWASRLPPSMIPSGASPRKSPASSPTKSPAKSSRDASPTKPSTAELERQRREELEQRLQQEEVRKEQKKKKKKMKF